MNHCSGVPDLVWSLGFSESCTSVGSTLACGARTQRDASMRSVGRLASGNITLVLGLVTTAAANGSVVRSPPEGGESSFSRWCCLLRLTRAFRLVGAAGEATFAAALEQAELSTSNLLFCLDVLLAVHMRRLVYQTDIDRH